MIAIDQEIRERIHEHAKESMPNEACGLLLRVDDVLEYVRITNKAPDRTHFLMDPSEYAVAEDRGQILAIVHSHPNLPAIASQADKVACSSSNMPWLIVGYPTLQESWLYPEQIDLPYLEREFTYGVIDCYTLAEDFYRREFGLALPARSQYPDEWEWWKKGKEIYSLKNWLDVGFVRVNEMPQYGDLHLIAVRSPKGIANHIAIQLEGGHILHHLQGQLSSKTVYGGYWLKATQYTVRHNSKCN